MQKKKLFDIWFNLYERCVRLIWWISWLGMVLLGLSILAMFVNWWWLLIPMWIIVGILVILISRLMGFRVARDLIIEKMEDENSSLYES